MTYVYAVAFGPALLMVLSLGLGVGVDRLAGRSLRGVLIVPVGFATFVVIGQLGTRIWAERTTLAALLLAVAGLIYGRERLRQLLRPEAWQAAGAMLVTYVVTVSPILFSGRLTMPSFLRDSSTGNHISGSHALLEHGINMSSEPITSDGIYLRMFFGSGYPSGGHVSFGMLDAMTPGNGLWLWGPFMACLLVLVTPSALAILRELGVERRTALVGAVIVSIPALTFSYAWMGAIKEISAVPSLVLLAALLVTFAWDAERRADGARRLIPMALAAGAVVGSIGVAGAAWVGVTGGALLVALVVRGWDRQALVFVAKAVVGLAVLTALLCLPTLLDFSKAFAAAKSFSQSNAVAANDPGNLFNPLHAVQVFGIWLNGDHRVQPVESLYTTYELIGVAMLLTAVGVAYVVRNRRWEVLVFVVGLGAVWYVLTQRGTIWTDAKLIVLTSPFAVLLVFLGVQAMAEGRHRLLRAGLVLVVAGGVLWSAALQYHGTILLPTDRYKELVAIGDRLGGSGTAYFTDFDEYAFAAMPDTHIVSPGFAYKPWSVVYLRGGKPLGFGIPVDIDAARESSLADVRYVIQRVGPSASRPPSNFSPIWRGDYYAVWERHGSGPLVHLSAGNGPSPTSRLACTDLRRAAARARAAGGSLLVATGGQTVAANIRPSFAQLSPRWGANAEGVVLDGAGSITTSVKVPAAGRYRVWLVGGIGRDVNVLVDGRSIGHAGYQAGSVANAIGPLRVTLTAGDHEVRIVRAGASLRPGDGAVTVLNGVDFQRDVDSRVARVAPSRWRTLCGRQVDWVEAVRGS